MKKLVSKNIVKGLKKYIGQEIGLETIEDTYQFFKSRKTYHGGRVGRGFMATLKAVERTGITVIEWPGDPIRKKENWIPFVLTKCFGDFYEFWAIVQIDHKGTRVYKGKSLDPKTTASRRVQVKFREYSSEHWPSMD